MTLVEFCEPKQTFEGYSFFYVYLWYVASVFKLVTINDQLCIWAFVIALSRLF